MEINVAANGSVADPIFRINFAIGFLVRKKKLHMKKYQLKINTDKLNKKTNNNIKGIK